MLTLYLSKASSALAPHILLEEAGAAYTTCEVPISEGAHRQPDYLRINPKGRVPALDTGRGIVTENPAILLHIAETHPATGLLPEDPVMRARGNALNAYICATVHVAFAHKQRGARWADDPAAQAAMQEKVAANLAECAALIEQTHADGPWALGEHYSFCDPYLFLVPRWLEKAGVPLARYPWLAAHRDAMLGRPSTRRVLAAHGIDESQVTIPASPAPANPRRGH